MGTCCNALTSIESSFHPCNIYCDCPRGVYPGEAKMCLRLSWGSQISPPAKLVKATTYRHDSPEVAILCLRLITETECDARSVGDSHPSCDVYSDCGTCPVLELWPFATLKYDLLISKTMLFHQSLIFMLSSIFIYWVRNRHKKYWPDGRGAMINSALCSQKCIIHYMYIQK